MKSSKTSIEPKRLRCIWRENEQASFEDGHVSGPLAKVDVHSISPLMADGLHVPPSEALAVGSAGNANKTDIIFSQSCQEGGLRPRVKYFKVIVEQYDGLKIHILIGVKNGVIRNSNRRLSR